MAPIEVKSGKDYRGHRAMANVLDIEEYALEGGVVLSDANASIEGKVSYLPIYSAGDVGAFDTPAVSANT